MWRERGAHCTRLPVHHYHWLTRLYRGTSRPCLIEPGGNAAYDYEAGTAVRRTTRSGDVSVSRQFQNAELLGQQTTITLFNGILGPLIDVGIPDWAVIGSNERNTAERVVRPMTVQQRGAQALTLRILATAFCFAVRCNEEPLDTAGGDVVDPEYHFAQTWRESGPLDRGGRRIARLRRDIQERVAKAIAVDQGERDCPVRGINGHDLVVYQAVVRVSVGEADIGIVHRSGHDRGVVDDAVDVHQRAVVRIANRAWMGNARWEGLILRASYDQPVWTEVHETGLEEKRAVGATRGRACRHSVVRQLFGEIHAKTLRLRLVACIEDDVPGGLQPGRRFHRALVQRQCDRSPGGTGRDVHSRQLIERYVELA